MENKSAKTFQDLFVWQKAHLFILSVYRFSETFPKRETCGLIAQIRRAAVSIAANIAEGFKKKTKMEKLRSLNIAQGSVEEGRYYLILAKDLGYGSDQECMSLQEETSVVLQ
jgi:four helix bundle protein